jgi:serine/threonine-protein kinase
MGKVVAEDDQFSKLLANLQANGVPMRQSVPTDAGQSRFEQADLDFLIRELAPYIGPMARVLVKRSARRAQTWSQLCEALANEIPEGAERKRFIGVTAHAPKLKPL